MKIDEIYGRLDDFLKTNEGRYTPFCLYRGEFDRNMMQIHFGLCKYLLLVERGCNDLIAVFGDVPASTDPCIAIRVDDIQIEVVKEDSIMHIHLMNENKVVGTIEVFGNYEDFRKGKRGLVQRQFLGV